jgi:hypothetical protein
LSLTPFYERSRNRRRRFIKRGETFGDFAKNKLIPAYAQMLTCTIDKETKYRIMDIGEDIAWIKLLKDIRLFYRLLFRTRFHRLDKREQRYNIRITKILLNELQIAYPEDYDISIIYDFFFQVHYNARDHESAGSMNEERKESSCKIYESNHLQDKEALFEDPVFSRLIQIFIYNFSDIYLASLAGRCKTKMTSIIQNYKFKL